MRAHAPVRVSAGVLAAVLAAIALPRPAAAQLLSLSAGGGPSFPAQEFNDESDTGYNLMASLWLRPPLLPVGLRGDAVWQSFPDDLGGDFRQLAGFVNAAAELPSAALRPYGLVGVGLVRHSGPDEAHESHAHLGSDDSDFAFQVGAGIRLDFVGLGGFAEARYMDMGEDHAGVPLTVGIVF